MKICITGAGGFIGSHLAEKLAEQGHEVRAFLRYNSKNSWGWLEESGYAKEMDIVSGDIRDFDLVRQAVHGCDRVFHLAALIGIPYSYVSPLAYVKTNVEGTYNVLQAARECGVERVIHTSTSEVYGTAQYVPIDEGHPINPQSPYSATKASADYLALSYYRSFGLPVTVVRPFNTYGPRQSARAIIPTIVSQLLDSREEISLGNITPTRDLTFVDDTVRGFLAASEASGAVGEVLNLGTGTEISVGDLALLIGKIMGKSFSIISDDQRIRPEKSEVERLLSNPSRMNALTGWKAAVSLEEGLERTVGWMKDRRALYKSGIYNV
ncbi:GDP-mannose 4,6-dehydratase [Aminivibrio sp.]|uniref:GDP-mannose 4,6-dehydratase n=1 Tax=Aminivibrio sp. TaxID=1872489 RepID=UPI001A4295AA|nr:GDP-mannose 4,6-dehydratase [Aminivibrio sp.]MBL3539456.1 GDP-mannose 4,6-dehydratase [Aminivibrio sp.]